MSCPGLEALEALLHQAPADLARQQQQRFRELIFELQRFAEDVGLGTRVQFLGHVRDSWEFMRSCHIGVIASVGSEAISRAAME